MLKIEMWMSMSLEIWKWLAPCSIYMLCNQRKKLCFVVVLYYTTYFTVGQSLHKRKLS